MNLTSQDPARILSVVIDAGTDNKEHLEDDLYLGWRHPRVRDGDYDLLVEQFVRGVQDLWKGALIHFEECVPYPLLPYFALLF